MLGKDPRLSPNNEAKNAELAIEDVVSMIMDGLVVVKGVATYELIGKGWEDSVRQDRAREDYIGIRADLDMRPGTQGEAV